MEIVENWSRIAGTVQEWQPPSDPNGPGTVVISVEDVSPVTKGDGAYPNFLAKTRGEIVHVQVPNVDARDLNIVKGIRVALEVRRGRTARRLFAKSGTIVLQR